MNNEQMMFIQDFILDLLNQENFTAGAILSLNAPCGDFEMRVINKEDAENLVCKKEDADKIQRVFIVEDLAVHVLLVEEH